MSDEGRRFEDVAPLQFFKTLAAAGVTQASLFSFPNSAMRGNNDQQMDVTDLIWYKKCK